jgi:hypothetical protein
MISCASEILRRDVIDSLEFRTQSFVIKVWLDEPDKDCSQIAWHGRVTHVPSGESCYVSNLEEITSFIAAYLERVGSWGENG